MAEHAEPEKKLRLSKTWQTYLFEFVSLAVAVFLGFLAENFRDELGEKNQAMELARSFYDELKADSIQVERTLAGRVRMDSCMLNLVEIVRECDLRNVPKGFITNYYSGIDYSMRFQPTDIVLEQLKSSGSLRYFKDNNLQKLIRDLGGAIAGVRQRTQIELEFGYSYIIPFNVRHFDQEYLIRISNGSNLLSPDEVLARIEGSEVKFELNNIDEFNRRDVVNMTLVYRRMVQNGALACQKYKKINNQLLAELRKTYDLE